MLGRGRKEVVVWSLYDFANSAFATLIVTFIFSRYFASSICGDEIRGTVLWTRAVNASSIVVALISPLLGAIADYAGRKKLFLGFFTAVCAIFTAMLFTTGRGDILPAFIFFVLANVGFEAANVFYNAFLPEVAKPEDIGRVSGIGWATGYAGGLLCMLIALGMIQIWVPHADDLHIRSTNLLAAAWYATFALPLFFVLKEKSVGSVRLAEASAEGVRRVRATFTNLRTFREAGKLLLASLLYMNGLTTSFALASIFGMSAFRMTLQEILLLGLWLNAVAGLGAWIFGFVNDRIGGKKSIAIAVAGLALSIAAGAAAPSKTWFVVAGTFFGLMVGPTQAVTRSLLGLLVPETKHAEAFGFYAFSGKASSILGPFVYGTVLQTTGSQRLAMGSMVLFFAAGLMVLGFLREREGIAAAAQARV